MQYTEAFRETQEFQSGVNLDPLNVFESAGFVALQDVQTAAPLELSLPQLSLLEQREARRQRISSDNLPLLNAATEK